MGNIEDASLHDGDASLQQQQQACLSNCITRVPIVLDADAKRTQYDNALRCSAIATKMILPWLALRDLCVDVHRVIMRALFEMHAWWRLVLALNMQPPWKVRAYDTVAGGSVLIIDKAIHEGIDYSAWHCRDIVIRCTVYRIPCAFWDDNALHTRHCHCETTRQWYYHYLAQRYPGRYAREPGDAWSEFCVKSYDLWIKNK